MVSAYTYARAGQLLMPSKRSSQQSIPGPGKQTSIKHRTRPRLPSRDAANQMASPRTLLLAAAMAAALLPAPASAATYMVGDAAGWDNGVVDYDAWARGKKFKVGDTLGTCVRRPLQAHAYGVPTARRRGVAN